MPCTLAQDEERCKYYFQNLFFPGFHEIFQVVLVEMQDAIEVLLLFDVACVFEPVLHELSSDEDASEGNDQGDAEHDDELEDVHALRAFDDFRQTAFVPEVFQEFLVVLTLGECLFVCDKAGITTAPAVADAVFLEFCFNFPRKGAASGLHFPRKGNGRPSGRASSV